MSALLSDRDGVQIWRGDARHISTFLAPESVDLIVTSPPYFALRSYTDGGEHYDGQIGSEASPTEFLDALIECTADWCRVLKPSGSMWVNLGDKYAGSGGGNQSGMLAHRNAAVAAVHDHRVNQFSSPRRYNQASDGIRGKSRMLLPHRYAIRCIDDLGLICRIDLVWSKPNGLPESVTDRVRASHEYWFHLTREPRYFAALDEIREPHTGGSNRGRSDGGPPPDGKLSRSVAAGHRGSTHAATNPDLFNPAGKLPGSVWTIPSEPFTPPDHLGVDHFAAFPTEWPRRLILGWSPEAGTVLDPFGGTGTVAAVARALGRQAIHVDLSSDYLTLAEWRIHHDDRTWRRTRERTGIPAAAAPLIDGQGSLFKEVRK